MKYQKIPPGIFQKTHGSRCCYWMKIEVPQYSDDHISKSYVKVNGLYNIWRMQHEVLLVNKNKINVKFWFTL